MSLAPRRRTAPVPPALRAAFAAGRRAHPDLDLGPETYFAAVAAAPRAEADHYLAQACEAGVPGAWERLQQLHRLPLLAFLARRGAPRGEAEALLDEAWGALAAPPPRGRPGTVIGTYDGRGSLRSWLRTIVWRRLMDRWRAKTPSRGTGEERDADARGPDPADRVADEEDARRLGRALEDAWSRLTTRELEAVVLKYRQQLAQTEIARALGVSPGRVTRILQSAAERLRSAIVAQLGSRADWDGSAGGWASLFETVGRILARTAATLDVPEARSESDA